MALGYFRGRTRRIARSATTALAIYDEQGVVKLSTRPSGVHVLKETTVQRSARRLTSAAGALESATGI